jgi:hypothetical protein
MRFWAGLQFLMLAIFGTASVWATRAQELRAQDQKPPPDKKDFDLGKKDFPFGPGPFGGPVQQERKLVHQFDRDGDGRLDRTERQAAREFLKKQGPGFGPGGFGPGKGKGPGFGPGNFIAKQLLQALDVDGDGAVTKDEAVAGIKRFLADMDKDQRGFDAAQLAAALSPLFPAPPGFPGGFGPAPPKEGKPKDVPPGGMIRFGPSTPLAAGIVKRADANGDEKATRAELLSAADVAFKDSDKNKDTKLDETELAALVGQLMPAPAFPGPGGFGKSLEPARPGPRVTPADVKAHAGAPLYEPTILRTLFLEFENADWEAELADFHGSDVEVPATLIVDGKKYPGTGVHFRGMSSYMMTPAGYKRSLNLSLDFVNPKQRLYGAKTMNLLNANGDASLLSTVLYSHIARQYIPAPKANLVKVVINGESWGVYTNVQQFNKEFVAENYKGAPGARWKVHGSPGGGGGLDYLGENIDDYRRRYQIKSPDNEKSWKALIRLCRTLDKTPLDQLEAALKPMLDIDGALRFLALDVVLSNSDGYWIRASDYNLVRDAKGIFHIVPHDMNEAFQPAMGFGFGPGFGPGKGKVRWVSPAARTATNPERRSAAPRTSRAFPAPGQASADSAPIRWSDSTTPRSRCAAGCWRCPA